MGTFIIASGVLYMFFGIVNTVLALVFKQYDNIFMFVVQRPDPMNLPLTVQVSIILYLITYFIPAMITIGVGSILDLKEKQK